MLKVGSLLSEYASIRRWTFAAHLIRFVRKHTCVPEWSFNCVVKVQTKHNYPAMVVLALRKSNTWPRGRGVANETWRPFEFCYGCGLLGPHLTLPSWHLTPGKQRAGLRLQQGNILSNQMSKSYMWETGLAPGKKLHSCFAPNCLPLLWQSSFLFLRSNNIGE